MGEETEVSYEPIRKVDLRTQRDMICAMLAEMSDKMASALMAQGEDDRAVGFVEGIYDHMVAMVHDLPVEVGE